MASERKGADRTPLVSEDLICEDILYNLYFTLIRKYMYAHHPVYYYHFAHNTLYNEDLSEILSHGTESFAHITLDTCIILCTCDIYACIC